MGAPAGFGWNPEKAERTFADRGISFEFAVRVFLDPKHIDFDVTRPEDGEERRKAVGMVDGRLYTVVYTTRGDVTWLISARRANKSEERKYGPVHP
jgi:uncharacterized DUF497 family protein